MKEYCIITESTCDMTQELADALDVTILPMTFTIGDQVYHNYLDGREMDCSEFYRLQAEGNMSQTAQVSSIQFQETFEQKIKQGLDILCINFSSALSGTCESAEHAAAIVIKKYPDAKIITIDSKCASVGQGLIVYLAAMQKKQGKDIEQAAQFVRENRLNVCHWFTVRDLYYLKRGGRISSAAALFGTMLEVKPILHVDDKGALQSIGKIRGREQSIRELAGRVEKSYTGQPQALFIGHGNCLEDAQKLERVIRERVEVEQVYISYVGPVIGTHTGPGLLVVANLGGKR